MMKGLVFWSLILLPAVFLLLQAGCSGGVSSHYGSPHDRYYGYPYDRFERYPSDPFYRYPHDSDDWWPYRPYPHRDFQYRYVPGFRYNRDHSFRHPMHLPDGRHYRRHPGHPSEGKHYRPHPDGRTRRH